MKTVACIIVAILALCARASESAAEHPATASGITNSVVAGLQHVEQIRADCLAGRRMICGKILRILPDGLVVDSGYTDLLRPPLTDSWLVPGRVSASRPANQMESREPGSVGIGMIFLTDLPKSRGMAAKPKLYDYVILLAYPTGHYTYTSVGSVQKTVRRFSANLLKAVNQNLANAEQSGPAAVPGGK